MACGTHEPGEEWTMEKLKTRFSFFIELMCHKANGL